MEKSALVIMQIHSKMMDELWKKSGRFLPNFLPHGCSTNLLIYSADLLIYAD
jgi:hypothetical protein